MIILKPHPERTMNPRARMVAVLAFSLLAFAIPPARAAAEKTVSTLALPTWKAVDEPWGAWREITFRDSGGVSRSLWYRASDRARSEKSWLPLRTPKPVQLFVLRQGKQDPIGKNATRTTFSSQISDFTLIPSPADLVMDPSDGLGKDFELTRQPRPTSPGSVMRVLPPSQKAGDAPPRKPKGQGQGKAPAGVDADVWALLAAVPGAEKDKPVYARVLQRLKAAQPKSYARIAQGGSALGARFAAAVKDAEKDVALYPGAKKEDALFMAMTVANGRLRSRLDAVLGEETPAGPGPGPGAPSAPAAPETGTQAGAPAGEEPGPEGELNFPNLLTRLLIQDPGRVGKAMAERFAGYIDGGADKKFVSEDVRAKGDLMQRLLAQPAAWVKAKVEQKRYAEVSELYFVMGAGDAAPSWVENQQLLSALTAKNTERGRLFTDAMEPWTLRASKSGGQASQNTTGDAAWAHRFLTYASGKAHALLADSRVKGEIGAGIISREEDLKVPEYSGRGGAGRGGAAKGFSYESLYLRGGVFESHVYAPGDPVSRSISIKIITEKGDKGVLVNRIAVYDVTYQNDTFVRKFDILRPGNSTTVSLDDRQYGMPEYTLGFEPGEGGNTVVTLGRVGNEKQMKTSINELFRARADQAIQEGGELDVGGRKYIVMGQGDVKGSLMFFPGDLKQRMLQGGGAKDLLPEMLAYVNTVGPDGMDKLLPGKRDLGSVDGKPYHLAFNSGSGWWQVGEGAGEPDAPAAPIKASGAGGGGGGVKPLAEAGPDATEYERTLQGQGFVRNEEVRNGLREDLREVVRVWTYVGDKPMPLEQRHVWIVPERIYKARNLAVPFVRQGPGDTDEGKVVAGEVRGLAHFIATTRGKSTLYYDLLQENPIQAEEGKPMNQPFAQAGSVARGGFSLSDPLLLADALEQIGHGQPAATAEAAAANLAKLLADKDAKLFNISGNAVDEKKRVKAKTSKGEFFIWPAPEAAMGDAGGHEGDKGPGHAMDINLAVDEPFPDQPQEFANKDINVTDKVYPLKTASDGMAALFANSRASPTRWYFMYKFKLPDGKALRSPFLRVFAAEKKEGPPFPREVALAGLSGSEPPNAGELRYLASPDNKRGAWYAVKDKRLTSKDQFTDRAKNCLGPVIWWGLDQPGARKACETESL
ncbi:MAG: hypothetical protein PHF00_04050 [Elusimicrobia bacterium]|nr:hypothetical protein [Elusimicrobiota bacterium]